MTLSTETVLDSLDGSWRGRDDEDQVLSLADFRALAVAPGLSEDPPQAYTTDGLVRSLSQLGPLLAIGTDGIVNDALARLRIVTSIRGDGSPDGTIVDVTDLEVGAAVPLTFRAFDQLHPASMTTGLFHY